ncbi:hypothetical protein [Pelagerythrobacter marensis]|uniref:hypothetical protein n=1 Tax=Pelagerythrobacter marensis TaxID=543877 RepID=UPI000649B371|nr:hypothetical protein [Pelagerythrobacter marensis]
MDVDTTGPHRMDEKSDTETQRLRRERDEAEHEEAIAKRLLNRAASEIETLADADCEDGAKDHALDAARRFRHAASR